MKGGKVKVENLQKFIESTYKNTIPDKIDDFILDKAISTKYTKVYHNPINSKTILSERPTQDLRDVASDILMGLDLSGKLSGKIDNRFKDSWRTYDAVKKKYRLTNTIAIGYSLGATVLERYPKVNEFLEVILVSKPVSPSDIINKTQPPEKATEIRSKYDPVSILKRYQQKAEREILLEPESYNIGKEHQQKYILPRIEDESVGDPDINIGAGALENNLMVLLLPPSKLIDFFKEPKSVQNDIVNQFKTQLESNVPFTIKGISKNESQLRINKAKKLLESSKPVIMSVAKKTNKQKPAKPKINKLEGLELISNKVLADFIIQNRPNKKNYQTTNKNKKQLIALINKLLTKYDLEDEILSLIQNNKKIKKTEDKGAYCGVDDKLPYGYSHFGSMKECAEKGQIKRFGRFKADPKIIENMLKPKENTRLTVMNQIVAIRGALLKLKRDLPYEKNKTVKTKLEADIKKLNIKLIELNNKFKQL